MRFSVLTPILFYGALVVGAHAMPMAQVPAPELIHRVQMQCTPQSCIDQRTGVYTQSTCNAYGCRPMGGPVGRLPGYGGGSGYGGRYAPPPPPPPVYGGGYRGGGGFDCNHLRCIDGRGRVWESTCDRYGCRPLQPARQPRW